MYRFAYDEVLQDAGKSARERERQALAHAVTLLKAGRQAGVKSIEAAEALTYVRRLWAVLVEDLSKPENELPDALRADLISIGLWIMKEVEMIRTEQSENFQGLIDISETIAEGLQ